MRSASPEVPSRRVYRASRAIRIPGEADIAARLDRLPSSRALWAIVVLISCGGVFEF
jgi:hypothetical protein